MVRQAQEKGRLRKSRMVIKSAVYLFFLTLRNVTETRVEVNRRSWRQQARAGLSDLALAM